MILPYRGRREGMGALPRRAAASARGRGIATRAAIPRARRSVPRAGAAPPARGHDARAGGAAGLQDESHTLHG